MKRKYKPKPERSTNKRGQFSKTLDHPQTMGERKADGVSVRPRRTAIFRRYFLSALSRSMGNHSVHCFTVQLNSISNSSETCLAETSDVDCSPARPQLVGTLFITS